MSPGYIYLTIAIIAEVIATSALKASEEFTKLTPSIIVALGYSVAFYMLSHFASKIYRSALPMPCGPGLASS